MLNSLPDGLDDLSLVPEIVIMGIFALTLTNGKGSDALLPSVFPWGPVFLLGIDIISASGIISGSGFFSYGAFGFLTRFSFFVVVPGAWDSTFRGPHRALSMFAVRKLEGALLVWLAVEYI